MKIKEPTKEQIKEFWEWCGFQRHFGGEWFYERYKSTNAWWEAPSGRLFKELPPIDLNNLFKFAVPKLFKFGLLDCSFHREIAMFGDDGELLEEEKISYRWRLLLETQILTPIDGYGKTPALALFWAIYEAMHHAN